MQSRLAAILIQGPFVPKYKTYRHMKILRKSIESAKKNAVSVSETVAVVLELMTPPESLNGECAIAVIKLITTKN